MTTTPFVKEDIKLGIGYNFRDLVHFHNGWGAWQHVNKHAAGEVAESSSPRSTGSWRRTTLGMALIFEITNSIPCGTLPPTWTHLLNSLK